MGGLSVRRGSMVDGVIDDDIGSELPGQRLASRLRGDPEIGGHPAAAQQLTPLDVLHGGRIVTSGPPRRSLCLAIAPLTPGVRFVPAFTQQRDAAGAPAANRRRLRSAAGPVNVTSVCPVSRGSGLPMAR
jgi:hypothetical protein